MIVAAAAAMHLTLLPIAPLILLPFAIIFFIVVFPFWGIALGILGLILLIFRGLNSLSHGSLDEQTNAVYRAFRWVLTFGGFVRLGESEKTNTQPTTQPTTQPKTLP